MWSCRQEDPAPWRTWCIQHMTFKMYEPVPPESHSQPNNVVATLRRERSSMCALSNRLSTKCKRLLFDSVWGACPPRAMVNLSHRAIRQASRPPRTTNAHAACPPVRSQAAPQAVLHGDSNRSGYDIQLVAVAGRLPLAPHLPMMRAIPSAPSCRGACQSQGVRPRTGQAATTPQAQSLKVRARRITAEKAPRTKSEGTATSGRGARTTGGGACAPFCAPTRGTTR